ncbi:MAG: hypothetical protein KA314_17420 [Chloroflexi bacterium]|nr:hypothetical protein [Chloroflexota bacterium]
MTIIAYAIISAVIDWMSLLFHIVWIGGLAIILAAFSYHQWQANQKNLPLRAQLNTTPFIRLLWLGLTLITLGLVGTSNTLWEAIIWIILLLISLLNLLKKWRPVRSHQ